MDGIFDGGFVGEGDEKLDTLLILIENVGTIFRNLCNLEGYLSTVGENVGGEVILCRLTFFRPCDAPAGKSHFVERSSDEGIVGAVY